MLRQRLGYGHIRPLGFDRSSRRLRNRSTQFLGRCLHIRLQRESIQRDADQMGRLLRRTESSLRHTRLRLATGGGF